MGVRDKSSLGSVGSKIRASIQRRSYLVAKMGQARTSSLEPKYSWRGAGVDGGFSAGGGTSSGGLGIDGGITVLLPAWGGSGSLE